MPIGIRANPLPVIVGFLSFQVTGWFKGDKIFDSLNSEAMLFTFLAGGTALLGWLFIRMDRYSEHDSYIGRTLWISSILIGVFFGLFCRFQI